MKSINFAGGALVTGDAVAASLLDYMSQLSPTSNSVTVDIPVLEKNGTISTHTIVLSAAVQLDVSDADGGDSDEAERFPIPELPDGDDVMVAVGPGDDAETDADNFNRAVADLDRALDQEDPRG